MKERELLDIFGEIDEELVEDAASIVKSDVAPVKRKRNFGFVKPFSIVAACVLILSGVMISKPLYDRFNSPSVETDGVGGIGDRYPEYDGDVNDGGVNGDHVESPSDEDSFEEMVPDTEAENGNHIVYDISGSAYEEYYLSNQTCDSSLVGERIGSINVNYYWSHMPSDVYSFDAELYLVNGINGELQLCWRRTDVSDAEYCFLNRSSYNFSSFEDMEDMLGLNESTLIVTQNISYYLATSEDYCRSFVANSEVSKAIGEMLLALSGGGVEPVADNYSVLYNAARSRVSFVVYLSEYGLRKVVILDNGYLYCSVFGNQLFEIGEEHTGTIIEYAIMNAVPQGYVWDEKEGWIPVKDPTEDPSQSIRVMLERLGILNSLKLHETVRYEERVLGFAPSRFTLDESLCEGIAGVIMSCDGTLVSGDGIYALADEFMAFEHIGENSNGIGIGVYSSGHISIGGAYYYVGEKYTDKIINAVKTDGRTPDNIYWNKDDECWQTYGPEDEEYVEDDRVDSVDHGYGNDVYEDEIASDTCIESIREE